jgi:4-amino-4-deoxychorismate lyase
MNSAAGAVERSLVNGQEGAVVSVLERGLHYGDGLFETIRCIEGRPRLLELHLARLERGCARLKMHAPDAAAIAADLRALAGASGDCVLKVILSRGTALARGYGLEGREQATRIALRYPWPQGPTASAGLRVRIADLQLSENPATAGIKHLNRLEQVLARAEWSDPEIAEALLFSRSGVLISGTMSNVFLVRGGILRTPRLDLCGVEGVMRQVVLAAARAVAIRTEERALSQADLDTAEEIFLTNALTGIRSIGQLGERTLAAGAVTRRLVQAIAPVLAGAASAPEVPR